VKRGAKIHSNSGPARLIASHLAQGRGGQSGGALPRDVMLKVGRGPQDTTPGQQVNRWKDVKGHKRPIVHVLTIDADVFSAGEDGLVKAWNCAQQANGSLQISEKHSMDCGGTLSSCHYSAATQWMFVGLATGVIKAFNKASGAQLTLEGHTQKVGAMLWHQEGSTLALISAGNEPHLRIWIPSGDQFVCSNTWHSEVRNPRCMVVLNSHLWVGGSDGLRVYNLGTGQPAPDKLMEKQGVNSLIVFGETVIGVADNGKMEIFNASGGTLAFLKSPCNAAVKASQIVQHNKAQMAILVSAHADGTVCCYTLPPQEFKLQGWWKQDKCIRTVQDTGNGMFLTGATDGSFTVYRWV